LLTRLIESLSEAKRKGMTLKPSLISYVFFPISTILRRNPSALIPGQILEKLLIALATLCEDWWWDMDVSTWEQIFMFSSAISGGLDGKGKGKRRDDEIIEAAIQCLWVLLRDRRQEEEAANQKGASSHSLDKFSVFVTHSRTRTFIPILGQTINSLLDATTSSHPPLQRSSLKVLRIAIEHYIADDFAPSILPGVVSSMCKVALATNSSKRWANGEVVALALSVTEAITIRAIGDDICVKEGAVRRPTTLEELAEIGSESGIQGAATTTPYATRRTTSWLHGTSSQLHIALNSLNPLVTHPSVIALQALASFSAALLSRTTLTLPQSVPLLLSFLLSLSLFELDEVSNSAKQHLIMLCSNDSLARHTLLQALLQIAKAHLMHLPRLIPTQADVKIEHSAGIIEAICNLATIEEDQGERGLRVIATEVSKLLGPSGGIERWGWSLLSALELSVPSITMASTATQLMLEGDQEAVQWATFPEVILRQVASSSVRQALERMLRALGRAAGENGLFAVEWFFGVGRSRDDSDATAALWCGTRILEGIAGIPLEIGRAPQILPRRKRLEKFARWLAKALSELWDDEGRSLPTESKENNTSPANDDIPIVERITGLTQIRAPLQVNLSGSTTASKRSLFSPNLHRALALQSLSVCAGVLQTGFTQLLLYTLYPVLNALVSEHVHLSSTALATLHYITYCTSYASPANLLLSNFDYALDAVSRRLNRCWLDVDATRVLVVLVRLVGRDVVHKAGDVVEECFDRLDEYHGYEILVDGLVSVLLEVVVVISTDEANLLEKTSTSTPHQPKLDHEKFPEFCDWFLHRYDDTADKTEDESILPEPGTFPRKAWGDKEDAKVEQEMSQTAEDPLAEPPPTPTQALTKLIVSRSLYFLTHGSALIRARILTLLSSAVPVLPSSALLPSIHGAWPFILNRFNDPEPFVVRATATLVEALATHHGEFMYKRIWEDIWPRFRTILRRLQSEDSASALARTGPGAVGTGSAYTHSHRLYTAILNTLSASVKRIKAQNSPAWEVMVFCRRFLHARAHEELQACAVRLYKELRLEHEDAVWLALSATAGEIPQCPFLHEDKWDIFQNVQIIFA
jgi:TELO2-interacting protein 1